MYRFVLRLAIHWGYPPSKIYQMLTSREISELMVYDSLYPFGDKRLGLEMAHLARAVAFGGLDKPSPNLGNYLLFDTPTSPSIADTVDAIKDEQLAVVENLDLVFAAI